MVPGIDAGSAYRRCHEPDDWERIARRPPDRKMAARRLRSPVGYFADEPFLLEGTVHENIARFGALSLMSLAHAAMRAGVHETLQALQAGYDTPVGPAGSLLSLRERRAVPSPAPYRAIRGLSFWTNLRSGSTAPASAFDAGSRSSEVRGVGWLSAHRSQAFHLVDKIFFLCRRQCPVHERCQGICTWGAQSKPAEARIH